MERHKARRVYSSSSSSQRAYASLEEADTQMQDRDCKGGNLTCCCTNQLGSRITSALCIQSVLRETFEQHSVRKHFFSACKFHHWILFLRGIIEPADTLFRDVTLRPIFDLHPLYSCQAVKR